MNLPNQEIMFTRRHADCAQEQDGSSAKCAEVEENVPIVVEPA
jgi:hypothetical protein